MTPPHEFYNRLLRTVTQGGLTVREYGIYTPRIGVILPSKEKPGEVDVTWHGGDTGTRVYVILPDYLK